MLLSDLLDCDVVLEAFTHLSTVYVELAAMPEVVDPVITAVEGLRLSKLIVMMRELEINPTRMDIDRIVSEHLMDHGRALDVPTWPALAKRRVPARLALFTLLPQGKVSRVLLVAHCCVTQSTFSLGQQLLVICTLRHQLTVGVLGIGCVLRDVKVDRSVRLVCKAISDDLLNEFHDIWHVFTDSGDNTRQSNIQRG